MAVIVNWGKTCSPEQSHSDIAAAPEALLTPLPGTMFFVKFKIIHNDGAGRRHCSKESGLGLDCYYTTDKLTQEKSMTMQGKGYKVECGSCKVDFRIMSQGVLRVII